MLRQIFFSLDQKTCSIYGKSGTLEITHKFGDTARIFLKAIELIGPAGSFIVDETFEEINSSRDQLTREEISQLIQVIGRTIEDNEKEELFQWAERYI
jgi:hypothetical protein